MSLYVVVISRLLVRMTITIDMSETIKFVYVYWVGKDVPFTKKGKFGIKSGSIKSIFEVNIQKNCNKHCYI